MKQGKKLSEFVKTHKGIVLCVIYALAVLIAVIGFEVLPNLFQSMRQYSIAQTSPTLSTENRNSHAEAIVHAPTPTPTPTPMWTPELVVSKAGVWEFLGQSSMIQLVVKNTSQYTIDAFDFKLRAYDIYGELISHSLNDSYSVSTTNLGAGEEWDSFNSLSTIMTIEGAMKKAKSFEFAITKYHLKETDETVTVDGEEQIWIEAVTESWDE